MHETLIIQQLHKNNIRKCHFKFQHSLSKVIRYHDDIKTNSKTDHLNWTELNGKTGVNCLCVCLSVCLKNNSPTVMQDPRGKLARCAQLEAWDFLLTTLKDRNNSVILLFCDIWKYKEIAVNLLQIYLTNDKQSIWTCISTCLGHKSLGQRIWV